MKAQIAHAIDLTSLSHITLQVVPYDAGAHPGMLGTFVVLQFGEFDAPDIVYVDSGAGDLLVEDEPSIRR